MKNGPSVDTLVLMAEALVNPESEPHQYTLQHYGYCTKCEKITPTTMHSGGLHFRESCECKKCDTQFTYIYSRGVGMFVALEGKEYKFDIEKLPKKIAFRLIELRSREHQALLVEAELFSRLEEKKRTYLAFKKQYDTEKTLIENTRFQLDHFLSQL